MYIRSRQNLKAINCDSVIMIKNQFQVFGHLPEWNHHIEMICKKVAAGTEMIKRIKPYVPANTLQTIYSALIEPYFDYSSPLWGVCNKTKKINSKNSKLSSENFSRGFDT